KKDSAQNYKNRNSLEVLEFYTGKVVSVADNEIRLNFGNVDCLVPDDGIKRIANIYGQTLSNPKDARKLWLQNIQVSDYLFISVRSKEENNLYVCDVEQRPSVQGGLIVLDKGRVLAAVGGFFPHEFHRAIFAQRQPGSTMKPLVMYAALQLNWNIFDQIPNIRSAYTWQGQLYFPSAPHEPATPTSNFVGVGAMSENFASVWLSVHLLDKLSMDQYFDVLKFTSLFSEKESESMFLQRLAQNYKVSVGESSYQEGVFQRALYNYVNSLQNESSDFVLALLQTMLYGHNFDRLQRRINNASQLELLKNNWLRWQRIAENARWYIDLLKKEIENSSFNVQASLQYFRLTPNRELAFLSADALSLKKARLGEDVTLVPINVEDFKQLLTDNPNLLEHVKLDGIMPLHVIESLRVEIANEWQQYQQSAWPQKLYWNQEVRVLAGLQYITQMLKEFGTQSSMQPILSYALGANDITLTELALSYQTMIEGRVYQFFEEEYPNQLLLIQAIEDENGILLWEAQEKSVQVVDTQLSAPLLSVLRATVTHGTGRAADGALILRSKDLQLDNKLQKLRLRVPSFGKTGTTNRSVNALYVGFLPVPTEDNILTTENMLTIASYVGYDDNQPMKRLRGGGIAGAEGALPAWVKVAESVIKEFDFGSKLSWEGLEKGSVVPLQWDKTAERVYTSLYGKEINVASTGVNSEATNQDLNTFIDDNALAKAGFVEAHAPGRISGGVFTPHAFFNLVQSVSFVQSENLYVLQDSLNDTGSDKNKITSDEDFLDIPKEPFSSNESESNASEQKITPKDSTTSSETIPELPEPLSTAP
ncbi:MAG: hypothetical protein QXD70_03895, partial [Candidatus Bathyarchaeia archaeon]